MSLPLPTSSKACWLNSKEYHYYMRILSASRFRVYSATIEWTWKMLIILETQLLFPHIIVGLSQESNHREAVKHTFLSASILPLSPIENPHLLEVHLPFLCPGADFVGQMAKTLDWLVVSTHLNNISQIGKLPQIGLKIKKYLKPPPSWRFEFWAWELLHPVYDRLESSKWPWWVFLTVFLWLIAVHSGKINT